MTEKSAQEYLLIVAAAEPQYETILSLIDRAESTGQVTLLWFADTSYEVVAEHIRSTGASLTVLPAGTLLSEALQDFGPRAASWLESLRRALGNPEPWWLSRLTEINFSGPPWFELLRLQVAEETIREHDPGKILWLADGPMGEAFRSLAANLGIPESGAVVGAPNRSAPNLFVRALVKWLWNLCSELTALIASRRFVRKDTHNCLVYAGFPVNWQRLTPPFYYRYTGLLRDQLHAVGIDDQSAYLIHLSRRSRGLLKSPRTILRDARQLAASLPDLPVRVVECSGCIGRLLSCYFWIKGALTWWLGWHRLVREDQVRWQNIDVWSLVKQHGIEAPLIDWPKNRYHLSMTASACRTAGTRSMIMPIFELVEGRAACAGADQSKTAVLGMQHGPHGKAHHWRFDVAPAMIRRAAETRYLPKCIATESRLEAERLCESGWPRRDLLVAGAARIEQEVPAFEPDTATRTAIILAEMHNPRLTIQVALTLLAETDWDLVVRPHPRTFEELAPWLEQERRSGNGRFDLSDPNIRLEDELYLRRPCVLVAGVTGATVMAARAGWPVAIVLSNWIPNFSPLFAHHLNRLFACNDPGAMAAWLDRLGRDLAYRRRYSADCATVGLHLIDAIRDQATLRLAHRLSDYLSGDGNSIQET